MKKFLLVLMGMALVFSSGQAWAKDGLYLGMDVGVAVAPDMDVKTGGLDDWSASGNGTRCDVTINPDRLQGGDCALMILRSGPRKSRLMAARGFWRDWPWGIAWAASGSRVNISIAAPGMAARLNPTSPTDWLPSDSREYGGGGAMQEYGGGVEDAVDNLMSHNVFANLYYDYRTDSKFTPYVGFGIGFAQVSVQYRTRWHRTRNADDINVFDRSHREAS